jgi:hypothetical protein
MSSSTKPRPSENRTEENREKSPPVFSRRAWTGTGSVEVAIFDKTITGDNGDFRVFNVLAKRSWKDDEGYQSSNSFRPEDVLPLALFLQEAYSFIASEQAKR